MSSPGDRSGCSVSPADLFEDVWRQLKECHQNTVQEYESKVSKLKKDRCLDAQKLEVFYNRNQQLKEQNKSLQDSIGLLEDRLRVAECGRCAALEEKLKSSQDQNMVVITKLKNENKNLEDENRNLQAELQKMKMRHVDLEETSERDEGVIPDSPILTSSLPAANRLRKRKHPDKSRRVRYAETPLPQKNNSLFNELKKEADGGAKNSGREVLVPNTCELDTSQSSNDMKEETEEVVAETCALEVLDCRHLKAELTPRHLNGARNIWKHNARLRPFSSAAQTRSPDSTTEKSPSLLPSIKRFSEEGSFCWAKRKKDSGAELQGEGRARSKEKVDNQKEAKPLQLETTSQTTTPSFRKEQPDNEAPNQKLNVSYASPTFKKPLSKAGDEPDGSRRAPPQDRSATQKCLQSNNAECGVFPAGRKGMVESTWSIDPALALSMFESEEVEEEQRPGELADTDCTWVSHSMLQRRAEDSQDGERVKSGLGEKANDSLDMMFDATTFGEYKSYTCSNLDQSQHCGGDDDDGGKVEEINDQDLPESPACHSRTREPTFAHVAVVRKKDERRKLKGTTCKECEVYYAHLPEEEKQKKLSACSRHRYRFIPPCTPENFWEVGFPSTQTCIERGYIREEKNPQARSRRRQPFNVLFTPKKSQEQS
ncbi:PREDICTED: DNA endonuclease RBBP8 isoform X4 [Poecilia mexicana]|uniref:DNA endonuclease RBBP8 isoform X4 n=1 Tax=Poecilia mexicana TaxID=48701 RepID=UPI00072E095A|nr:PREDICTED: DNA endonuclease RBBP8 isoform X4 [Poecilia mexicana]